MQKSRGFEGELIIEIPTLAINKSRALPLIHSLYITRMGFYPKALHHYYQRPLGISKVILIYCTHGKGRIQIQNKIISISAGEIFVIPKNVPHSYVADAQNPWTIYWFHLDGNNVNDVVKAIMNDSVESVQVGFSNERNQLFKQISNTLLKGYSANNLLFANLSLSYYLSTFITTEHFQRVNDTHPVISSTDKAIKFMQENLANTLTLEDIAQSAHLSISFFSKKFKEDTGYAPIEYFNHLRIQKACQLLHFTALRINEVASAIGIDDPFYFSRLFKQQMGVSPVQYRKGETNS